MPPHLPYSGSKSLAVKSTRILLNYLAMFAIITSEEKLPFADITFRNFAGVKIELEKYLDRFETGAK